jgi:hypothetical protein
MPKPKNARHLIPDPENEPDFYSLSNLYPLADQDDDSLVPQVISATSESTILHSLPSAVQALPPGNTEGSYVQHTYSPLLCNLLLPSYGAVQSQLFSRQSHGLSPSLLRQQLIDQVAVLNEQSLSNKRTLYNSSLKENLNQNNPFFP